MPKKQPIEPPKVDWAAFVAARRLDELRRQHCRPSQMIEQHARNEWDSGPARVRYYRDRITGKIPPR